MKHEKKSDTFGNNEANITGRTMRNEVNMIKSNYSIRLDKELESIATLKNGQQATIETVNAYGEHFSDLNGLMDLISNKYGDKHHHPLTGPINIEGAKAGDVLKVNINNIDISISGQALSKSAGIAPIKVNEFSDRAPIISTHKRNSKYIKYMNGMWLKYRPMLGIIGTAPKEGVIKTGHAAKTGGNLDLPFISQGCSVYLPVEIDDAGLYVGDAHAAQGYGELGGIALEASAIVDITVNVLKPKIKWDNIVVVGKEPLSDKTALGVVGVGQTFESLNEAVYDSYSGAINIVSALCPTLNKGYVCNVITAIGHSMNGQAFSKTSESTCIVNVLEDDLRILKKDEGLDIRKEIDTILFEL
mgnify:CR=1 FL=1